jgi:hypothetical protein
MPASALIISACLIVRDEQRQLPLCLASLAELVDEIVVCDTGSTDATVAVAQLGWAPARTVLEREPWRDHFAGARNAALARCSGDWVLSVDADEVAFGEPAGLRELLAGTPREVSAFAVEILNSPGPDRRGLRTRFEHKLFRRSAAHWTGRVHEQLTAVDGGPLAAFAMPRQLLRLRHDGYRDAAAVRAKAQRNARLCELELAALNEALTPPDAGSVATLTLDLGRSQLGAGQPRAAEACFARVRSLSGRGDLWRWATDFLARLAVDEERPNDVLRLAHELEAGGAQRGYCDWLRAQALALSGDLDHAELILTELLRHDDLCDVGGNRLETEPRLRLQSSVTGLLAAV